MGIDGTCCFTGHRAQRLPFRFEEQRPDGVRLKALLREEVERLITAYHVTHFISGLALGADLIAAETVLALQARYPFITLEGAIPHLDQTVRWPEEQRARYERAVRRCDRRTVLQDAYTPDCYRRRNRYMVAQSAHVLAIWDGGAGGTRQTVETARRLCRHLVVIDPVTWEITEENPLYIAWE